MHADRWQGQPGRCLSYLIPRLLEWMYSSLEASTSSRQVSKDKVCITYVARCFPLQQSRVFLWCLKYAESWAASKSLPNVSMTASCYWYHSSALFACVSFWSPWLNLLHDQLVKTNVAPWLVAVENAYNTYMQSKTFMTIKIKAILTTHEIHYRWWAQPTW